MSPPNDGRRRQGFSGLRIEHPLTFQLDSAEPRDDRESGLAVFSQSALHQLEQSSVICIGGFECLAANDLFELLAELLDTLHDVVEFVEAGAKLVGDSPWNLALKTTVNFITFLGDGDFTFRDKSVILILGVHGNLLDFCGKNFQEL